MTIKIGARIVRSIALVCFLALLSIALAGSAFATAPTVTSFSPTSAAVGASVSIVGTGFSAVTAVKVNTTSVATYTVVSSTSITATVPVGATTGKISVTTSGGTGTSSGSLTVVAAPTITSFSPTTGAVGATVTITGTNFTGASGVKVNTTAVSTFTVVSASSITAVIPTGASSGTISVTNAGVTVASSGTFTVVSAPTITSFTPTSGPIATPVTITGSNLTGTSVVKFNTTSVASFTVGSSSSITTTVPGGATTGKLSVTNAGVTVQSTASFTVTVPAAPTGLSATGGSEKVVLGWTASVGAATYNVYRGTSAGHESTTAIVTGLTSPAYTDTGISDGSTYYYDVKAVNTTGTSSASSEAHAEPVAAPTSLYVTQEYSGAVYAAFGWNASSAGAATYNLYRGVTPGGESSTPVASGGTNTFANDYGPLTLGTTYYYVVKGVNSTGLSSSSNEVEIIPIAPTTLSGTFLNASASLTWTAVSGASSYNLYGGTSTVTGITGTSYTATGLTNNQEYDFVVTAVNAAGEGPASNTVSGYPNPTPTTPSTLTATAISSYIHLNWVSTLNGCTYSVFRGTTPGGEGGTAILTTSSTAINDTTVVAGTTYYYKVSATNGSGTSGLSNEASAATLIPPALTLTSSGFIGGNNTITAHWTNVSPAGLYNTYIGTYSGGETLYIGSVSGTGIGITSGLYANVTYYMYVTSLDSGGHESAHSNEISALMPLDNPAALTAAWSGSSVLLNWAAVSGATTYAIQRQIGSGTTTTIGSTSSTTYTDSTLGTLPAGTSINYIVDASSSLNTDHGGSQVFITTPTVAPSGLTAAGGIQLVNLSWTGSTGTNYYNIKRSTTSGGPYTTVGAEGASPTTYTDTGLSDNTTYYYVVSSVYTGGESANSSQATVTTAPTAPTSLSATGGPRQVSLAWTASAGASTYNIYQSSTTGGPYTEVGSSSSASFAATGLSDTTAYFFVVTAVNSGGAESGYSNEAAATTWIGPPTIGAVSGNGTVTVSWNAVSGVLGYTVYRSAWGVFGFTNISGGTLVTGTSYVDSTVTNGVDYYYVVTDTTSLGESAYSNIADAYPSPGAGGSAVYQLNCGGPAVGTWLADTSGQSSYSTTNSIDLSRAVNPAPEGVYQTSGVSNTSLNYTVPGLTPGGSYTVRLHFGDAYDTLPGQRAVTVSLQGSMVLSGYDLIQAAGGPNIATVLQLNTTADSSGNIAVSLAGIYNYPILSGLEVLSGASVSSAPFNLHATPGHAQVMLGWNGYAGVGVTGYNVYRGTASGGPYTLITSTPVTGSTYTDSTASNGTTYFYVVTAVNSIGESERSNEAFATPASVNASVYRINCGGPAVGTWSSDTQGYIFSTTTTPILTGLSNPAPAAVYQTNEYGSVTHVLPYLAPSGSYVLRLHFDDYSANSNTNRLNVTVNGTQVLTNFDVRAASGTAGEAVIEQFNVAADTSGNITVAAASTLGNGGISGIELLTDSLAPSQPTRLFAWRGNTQVALNWNTVYGGATYKVYRSLTSGGAYTLVASGLTSPTYSDPTVTNYYYVVTAVNSTGESGYSNEAFPAAPFVLTASPSSVSATTTGYATSRIIATSNTDFAGTISYSGSSGPTGVTGLLYPASSVLGSATEPDITITTGTNLQLCTSGAATGTDPITITGTCGDYTASTTVNLTVH